MSDLPTKICPGCKRRARFDAKQCAKCGHQYRTIFNISEAETGPGPEKTGMSLGIWVAIVAIFGSLLFLVVWWKHAKPMTPRTVIVSSSIAPMAALTAAQMESRLRANMAPAAIKAALGAPDSVQQTKGQTSGDQTWLYHRHDGTLTLHIDGYMGLDKWQTH